MNKTKYIIKRLTDGKYLSNYNSYGYYFKESLYEAKQFTKKGDAIKRCYDANINNYQHDYATNYKQGESVVLEIQISENGIKIIKAFVAPEELRKIAQSKSYFGENGYEGLTKLLDY